jgi:hypothetical protein
VAAIEKRKQRAQGITLSLEGYLNTSVTGHVLTVFVVPHEGREAAARSRYVESA